MSTLISVIMPVYNERDELTPNFGNLVYQSIYETYGEDALEIILIDDASTDGTAQVVDDIVNQFPTRVKGYHLPERLSQGGACNVGLEQARGFYVAFMTPADMLDVRFYETLYYKALGEGFAYDYVDSTVFLEGTEKTILSTPAEFQGELSSEMRCALLADTGLLYSKIFRKDFLTENHIRLRDHTVSGDADEDFIAEAICRARNVAVSTEPLYVRKKKEKRASLARTDLFTEHFSALVSSCIAVYGRLSGLPAYEEVRLGAETFYLRRLAMTLRLYEKQMAAGKLASPYDEQLLTTIRFAAETIIRTPIAENAFATRALSGAARERLQRYLGM